MRGRQLPEQYSFEFKDSGETPPPGFLAEIINQQEKRGDEDGQDEQIHCQYCQDVGFCQYCERGKLEIKNHSLNKSKKKH